MADRRWTRRDLLRLAAGGLALGPGARAVAGAPAKAAPGHPVGASWFRTYGGFRMGLQSASLRRLPLDEVVARLRELDLHFVELCRRHLSIDAGEREIARIREMMRRARIRIDAYGVVPFRKGEADAARVFALARKLGIRALSADPDPSRIAELDGLCRRHGIRLGIHNHGPGHRWATPKAIAGGLKGASDRIGLCVDTGHFLRAGIDPIEVVERFGRRLVGVHLKDHDREGKKAAPLGKGSLRLVPFLKALRRARFSGFFSLEYEADPPMPGIRSSLAAVREAVEALPPPRFPFPRARGLPRTPMHPKPKGI